MKHFSKHFEYKTRTDKTGFYCIKDDSDYKDALQDFVHSIHKDLFFDCLPNDWVYEQIYNAFERLAECTCERDFEGALSDIETDIYINDLLEWAKWPIAREYITQCRQDFGWQWADLDKQIAGGQLLAIDAIYRRVWEFLDREKEV